VICHIRNSGAIGALTAAKQNGLLPMVTPLFDQLIAHGFRMREELYRRACRLANEA
jgi:predicted nucleic acid-binding protein